MPRGVKRSEIEIIQAEIAAAEKKREQGLKAASDAKKVITKLENKIDQEYAREIAKAGRAAGIPLKEVLDWMKARQTEGFTADKPATSMGKPVKKPAPVKKAKPASPRTKKASPATARTAKGKRAAKPKSDAAAEGIPADAVPASDVPAS